MFWLDGKRAELARDIGREGNQKKQFMASRSIVVLFDPQPFNLPETRGKGFTIGGHHKELALLIVVTRFHNFLSESRPIGSEIVCA